MVAFDRVYKHSASPKQTLREHPGSCFFNTSGDGKWAESAEIWASRRECPRACDLAVCRVADVIANEPIGGYQAHMKETLKGGYRATAALC